MFGVPVSVTVTVELPFGVVTPLDPQPGAEASKTAEKRMTTSLGRETCLTVRLLRLLQRPSSRRALKGRIHATEVGGGVPAVTVKVTLCGAVLVLEKAIVAGTKVHCTFTGRPEHAISTPPT